MKVSNRSDRIAQKEYTMFWLLQKLNRDGKDRVRSEESGFMNRLLMSIVAAKTFQTHDLG